MVRSRPNSACPIRNLPRRLLHLGRQPRLSNVMSSASARGPCRRSGTKGQRGQREFRFPMPSQFGLAVATFATIRHPKNAGCRACFHFGQAFDAWLRKAYADPHFTTLSASAGHRVDRASTSRPHLYIFPLNCSSPYTRRFLDLSNGRGLPSCRGRHFFVRCRPGRAAGCLPAVPSQEPQHVLAS